MWIERLTTSRTAHAAEVAAQFAEQRQRVLADNLANIDTPDYATKRLDPEAFQASLRQALDRARTEHRNRLELRGNAQFSTGPAGRVTVQPAIEPAPYVLLHDGTNALLERLMGDIAGNSLSYELATTLLRGQYEGLLRAIRGRVT